MSEIKCPHCNTVFQVDGSGYQEIVSQIRNKVFDEDVHKKISDEIEKVQLKAKSELDKKIAEKDLGILGLKKQLESQEELNKRRIKEELQKVEKSKLEDLQKINQQLSKKDVEVISLSEKIKTLENVQKSEIEKFKVELENQKTLALSAQADKYHQETESQLTKIAELEAKIKSAEEIKNAAIEQAVQSKENQKTLALNAQADRYRQESESQRTKIAELEVKIKSAEELKNATINQVIQSKENEIGHLKANIQVNQSKFELEKREALLALDKEKQNVILTLEKDLEHTKNRYNYDLQRLQEELEREKDFKRQQSTKMVGESLEKFAYDEFNKVRSYAFPKAYFEKDNDARSGSKGDFIYREIDENGIELLSIMFEMKNEIETTKNKHKNEDFLRELDKDRTEKGCEYAVLVSMLEADNDYYNTGIVDVSHKYSKMYVVRPNFFIHLIGILRNAALNSLKYKQELHHIRNQNVDVTNFENDLQDFKLNFNITAKNFNGNLEKLDKNLEDSIKKLQAARDELRKAMKNLGTAENKLGNLQVKKLIENNPTMQAKFAELDN